MTKQQQPLTTENYQYKLDEARRARLQAQVEQARLAALTQGERPVRHYHLPNLAVVVGKIGTNVRLSVRQAAHVVHIVRRGHRIKGA